ncbi:NAD(P)/FAD-dependent oxidoreductase [Thalassobaculum sp.]|uniref:FAD/NAD(P)-dependent oxidoreductase n=1 Tax=Thalassobaculum sp. TaxID=2022740 RepID=UPI0032EF2B20
MDAIRDLVIVGAGPAGLAAAAEARRHELDALILDEQPEPGGQVYRSAARVAERRPADLGFLGADYARGAALVAEATGVERRQGASVWQIGPAARDGRREVIWSEAGQARRVAARSVIVASGAMERPVPVPGWTLPGVTTVGALQVALKQSGIYPAGRVVIAGSGPLPLLLAEQLRAARVPVAAILDTAPSGRMATAWPLLPMAALGAAGTLRKGMALLRARERSGVPVWRQVRDLRAEAGADGSVAGIRFRTASGEEQRIEADLLALHEGVVPNPQLTRLVRADHRWHPAQRCFHPVLDPWGESTAAGVYVAGDGGGILGARAAEASGRLAVLSVAHRLGRIGEAARDFAATGPQARLLGERALRRLLDALYPAPEWIAAPADDAIVCRCEEVTAADLRAVAGHAAGPNQAKAYLRCGMGPCQGRLCGLTVTEMIARARGTTPAETGYYRIRAPIKPVTVDELASLDTEPAA